MLNNPLYKIIKYPFFGSFMVKWRNPLSEKEKEEWESVSVKSKSGGVIQGLIARTKTDEEKATIVLGHPMGKEAKGYFVKRGYTELLRKNGFNVVIFDINGFGESTNGNFSYFEDIVSVGIKVKELTPNVPLGYHGISLGAMWGTVAFADENHTYDFAIIESAATTLIEFWTHFPVAHKVLKLFNVLLPKYRRKIEMIERIKEAKNLHSLLFIYSEADQWVPVSMGERFKLNSAVPAELWIVKESRHAEIMRSTEKETYEKKIVSYFNKEAQRLNEKK